MNFRRPILGTRKTPPGAERVAEILAPGTAYGVVSGPGFAEGLAMGYPNALVVATNSGKAATLARAEGLSNDALRVYANSDLVGVPICGALDEILDGLRSPDECAVALMARGIKHEKSKRKSDPPGNGRLTDLV
jgi:glycerol-3-phosphate dehydrogenase (NAD(P)+)